jgi:16S rRNA A1518/A1519 N6-dimethyltransferase RsmA/KsgA/DIM1 with predicted DNA glycosylase/AP lyase activity
VTPLLTESFIKWLNKQELKNSTIIEFGSGESTEYFNNLFKKTISFEHDPKWYEFTKSKNLNRTEIHLLNENVFDDYYTNIKEADYILIDNDPNYMTRGFIASMVLEKCHTDAQIILDNSEGHPHAYTYLSGMHINTSNFTGKNKLNQMTTTSLFYERL